MAYVSQSISVIQLAEPRNCTSKNTSSVAFPVLLVEQAGALWLSELWSFPNRKSEKLKGQQVHGAHLAVCTVKPGTNQLVVKKRKDKR